MLDFTSALYLGLRHPSASLAPWEALTLGRPAALQEPPGADQVAADLARLQGCEAATLLPSTLHLFWDLLRMLAREGRAILLDSGSYPIARWAAACAAARSLRNFPHHDPAALERLVRSSGRSRPVIVADGYCPGCGRIAPVAEYARIADASGGYLVLDDTQALGILGNAPSAALPYGEGGGGSLHWHGTFGPGIVVGASLAKAFGAPLAVLSGSQEFVERFRQSSETRVHASPPSLAAIGAARLALQANRRYGEILRGRLIERVARLRRHMARAGLVARGEFPFPVQSFVSPHRPPVALLHRRLLCSGVKALLTKACGTCRPALTFVVTARHRLAEIDFAGRAVARLVANEFSRCPEAV